VSPSQFQKPDGVFKPFRLDIPDHVADVIRSLHPDLRRSVRAAVDGIASNPDSGVALHGELAGYQKYKVRRFRIVYAVDRKRRLIRLMIIAHRRSVYEDLAAQLKKTAKKK